MKKMMSACLAALLLCLAAAFAAAEGNEPGQMSVTLYFRYADTQLLGVERASLDIRREETVATLLVEKLIAGPGVAHDRLSGLFPQGTRLISAAAEGETAFITLSSGFLGKPDGAPSDWEEKESWRREAALRRRMAFQSIVLALTDEGRYQRVQLYIADSDDEIPQRIALTWFDPEETDPDLMLAACGRDETLALTPARTLETVLEAWKRQDWKGVYAFLSRDLYDSPASESDFVRRMAEVDSAPLDWQATEGTVSLDGQAATVILDAELRMRDGTDEQIARRAVPLRREDDNWTIAPSALLDLMVRD